MSLLNPAKLRSEVEAREARKKKVFEHILEMCYNKIILTNQQNDDCCCIFTCPSVVFGLPLFNLMDCIKFIMIKLIDKGFEVHLAVPNNIFISWKKESNPDYSRQMYQLELPASTKNNRLSLMPPLSNNHNTTSTRHSNNRGTNNNFSDSEYKLFSSKPTNKKEKSYRPIEDYRHTSGTSGEYALDDIDLFHSKLDELLA